MKAFRVPTMKALIQPVQQAPVNADRIEVDIQVSYLSGGGGNAPVKLRGLLQPKAVSFPDYEGFVFANSRVQEGLTAKIETIHRRSRGTYGSPRVHAQLRADGVHVSRKRVARLMRRAGLQGVSRRRFVTTTQRNRDARPAPDLVKRNFQALTPE